MTNDTHRCPRCQAELPADAPQGACPKCLLSAGFESADGAPEGDVPERAEVERLFPDMEVLEVLGRGGMGIVFKARQTKLDRLVALKVLPRAVAESAGDVGRFEDRFTREARALARLAHPNIVGVHEFGEREGLYYFVMEYVDGANLRQAMEAGRLTPTQALAIVPPICDALQYAHDQGVVHRDIKPENVLIASNGVVKIADFGLAKLIVRSTGDRTLTRQGLVMGTPHYMAPEQVENPGEVDHRADIYSLGVVIYEMLTGELPIGRFARPSEKVSVDVRLDDVVLRTLEKDAARRYQHVSDVKTSIGDVSHPGSGAAVSSDAPTPHSHGRRPYSKLAFWGLLATPITVLLLAIGFGIAYVVIEPDGTDRNADVGMGLSMVIVGIAALGLLTAIGLSIAAIVGIARSNGRKHGMALAVIGLLLPLLCCVPVGGSAMFVATREASASGPEPLIYPFDPVAESVPAPEPSPETPPDER